MHEIQFMYQLTRHPSPDKQLPHAEAKLDSPLRALVRDHTPRAGDLVTSPCVGLCTAGTVAAEATCPGGQRHTGCRCRHVHRG